MTVNQKIKKALEPFGYPVKPDQYTGSEKRWITFNEADNRAVMHGNNRPLGDRVAMQIHFFLPLAENYLKERREIRQALLDAGLERGDLAALVYEQDVYALRYEEFIPLLIRRVQRLDERVKTLEGA